MAIDQRPTLTEILAHDFFVCGPFPATISNSTMTQIPDYRRVSIRASLRNFNQVKADCGIVEVDVIESKLLHVVLEDVAEESEKGDQKGIDREVREALQPGSPISELLRFVSLLFEIQFQN